VSNKYTLSKTKEDEKLLARLEQLRPKHLSTSRMIWAAVEYFNQTHKKRSDEVIDMGPPTLADDIEIWKSIIQQMSNLQITDAVRKTEQIQGALKNESAKR